MFKYTVNGLRLQANIASAVLTYTTFCYKHIRKERKKEMRVKFKIDGPSTLA